MPMPTTMLQDTLRLVPDSEGKRWYGNVYNMLEVALPGKREFFVPLAVPTELFTLFKEVCKIPPEIDVFLSLDLVGDAYVLSAMAGEDLYDLCSYGGRSLPEWVLLPEYRL